MNYYFAFTLALIHGGASLFFLSAFIVEDHRKFKLLAALISLICIATSYVLIAWVVGL